MSAIQFMLLPDRLIFVMSEIAAGLVNAALASALLNTVAIPPRLAMRAEVGNLANCQPDRPTRL